MRLLTALLFASLVSTVPLGGQTTGDDPYEITFVRNNLQTAIAMPGMRVSFAVKGFQRLGDGVSIAVLKIVDAKDMTNVKTIEGILQIVHDSFSYPPIISVGVNKKPKVTLFLLSYLQRNVADTQTQREIEQTIEYVKHQTAPTGAQ
jgi:hypothetical protein